MSRRIGIKIGEHKIVCDLLDEDAPRTCDKLWEVLPVKSVSTNAKFVGDELIVMVPFMADEENQLKDVGVGTVGYYPMQQTLCIFFGDLLPFGFCNIVAKVTEGLDGLKPVSEKIVRDGVLPAEVIRVE
jgi:hypothetical protein